MSTSTIFEETRAANQIVRIARAYCDAQNVLTGSENPQTCDRQWQACCGVAARFLANPVAMTPELCHHEWRLSQMRYSHPDYWPWSAKLNWSELAPTDQYLERAGLAAMRQELHEINFEQKKPTIELLHTDVHQEN